MNEQTRKIYRPRDDRVLGGVCAGLGRHFNSDPILWRVLFLISITFGGLGILVYLICWLIIPGGDRSADEGEKNRAYKEKRLFRSAHNKILAGVCGGIAEYFEIDPTLVRLGFVVSILIFGITFLVYFLMWLIVPIDQDQT